MNPNLLQTARTTHQALVAAGRLIVVQDSALELSSQPDSKFDWVCARYVLQHLPAYPTAINTIRRVLKAGGRFVAVETTNSDLVLPRLDLVDNVVSVWAEYRDQFHRNGGSPGDGGFMDLTSRLVPALREKGFDRVSVDGVLSSSQERATGIEDFLPLLDPRQFWALVRAEWITAAELYAARAQWQHTVQHSKQDMIMIGYSVMYSAVKRD